MGADLYIHLLPSFEDGQPVEAAGGDSPPHPPRPHRPLQLATLHHLRLDVQPINGIPGPHSIQVRQSERLHCQGTEKEVVKKQRTGYRYIHTGCDADNSM